RGFVSCRKSTAARSSGKRSRANRGKPNAPRVRLSLLLCRRAAPGPHLFLGGAAMAKKVRVEREYLTTAEAAELIGVAVRTLNTSRRTRPDFPRPVKPAVNHLKWRRKALIDWMERQTVATAAEGDGHAA